MKLTLTTILVLSAFVTPSFALTLDQAYDELAGMHCSGSSCTSETTVSTTVDNPDIVNTVIYYTGGQNGGNPFGTGAGCMMTTMDHKTVPARGVNADCVASSISYHGVSRSHTVTKDGGTSVVHACETTTKTLTYNGPNTDRAHAWSVDTSVSSSDGAC